VTFDIDSASVGWLILAMLGALLFAATLLGAGVTVGLSLTKSRHAVVAAKLLGVAALSLLAVGIFASASGLVASFVAARAPGLSAADGQRMLSNGLAESMYGLVITVLVALPALLVAWQVCAATKPT
jgi:hypothetical protein